MTLHVEMHGTGPDLVLLHGWAMHSGVFASLLPTLSRHYRVHLIDLPGHGRSAFHESIGQLDALANYVRGCVPDHALLMGWSLGGLLALKLAQQMPVRGMVLINTTPRFVAAADWPHGDWSYGMAPAVFADFFSRLQKNLPATVQGFLALQVRGDSDAAHTLHTLQELLLAHPGDPHALQLGLQILRDADERAALPSLAAPVLVISGEYDRITHPKACADMAARLPHARACEIKRAGHAPFISHPEEFMKVVSEFLAHTAHTHAADISS